MGAYFPHISQPLLGHLLLKLTRLYIIACSNVCLSQEITRSQTSGASSYTFGFSSIPHWGCPLYKNTCSTKLNCLNELTMCKWTLPLSKYSVAYFAKCFSYHILFHFLEYSLSCIFYPLESNVCFLPKHQGCFSFTNRKWQNIDFLSPLGRSPFNLE